MAGRKRTLEVVYCCDFVLLLRKRKKKLTTLQ